jgi:hypothetical protein
MINLMLTVSRRRRRGVDSHVRKRKRGSRMRASSGLTIRFVSIRDGHAITRRRLGSRWIANVRPATLAVVEETCRASGLLEPAAPLDRRGKSAL